MAEAPPANASLDDEALLRQFQDCRGEEAFGQLVERHGRLVWSVCRRRLDRREDAEDAFQTTFLILAIRAGTIRQPKALAGWLHRTATRLARRMATQSPREAGEEQEEAGLDALAEVSRREAIAAVDDEIEALPRQYREAVVLFHLDGLPRREVARRLGTSEAAVKARLSRGRSLLRSRLARRGLALPLLLPLAADPLPAGAADSATRLASHFGRTRISAGDLLKTTLTQGTHPMLSLITGKLGLAVLAGCLGLVLAWFVRDPLQAGNGQEPGVAKIETTLENPTSIEPGTTALALLQEETEQAEEEEGGTGGASEEPEGAGGAGEPAEVVGKKSPTWYPVHASPPVREILQSLRETVRAEFPGISLRDALGSLAHQKEINIVIQETAIQEEGLSAEVQVDLFLNNVTLQSVLDLMLERHGLAYVVDNECLLITTETVARSQLATRAYSLPSEGEPVLKEVSERLKTLLVAQHNSAETPVIEAFGDRLVVVASHEDQKRLRELLRLIYRWRVDAASPKGSFGG